MKLDNDGVPRPATQTQREKLEARISELESQALSLEERAEYAETEAKIRERIRDAQSRIKATRPASVLDNVNLVSSFGSVWSKIPAPIKLFSVLITVIVVLLLLGKSCSGG